MNEFTDINSNLTKLLKEFNIGKIQQTQLILEAWDEVVGDVVSKNTRPSRFINGTLNVEVSNSSWLNQMSFFKEDIIEKYKLKLKKHIVKDIRFFIMNTGGSPLPPTLKVKHEIPPEQKKIPLIKELPEEDKRLIQVNGELIEDDKLKESLKKLFDYSRRKELTQIKEGWKKCLKCASLHNNKGDLCRYCQIKD